MNYFAHAMHCLDRPYFLAGAAVPDWLAVADRPLRLRSVRVEPFAEDPDPCVAELAGGVLQHLRDDAQFHATRAFAETSLELTVRARDVLGRDAGFRPAFLGHLLTELLLDAVLIEEAPERLTAYYRVLETLDVAQVEAIVSRMTPRPTRRLAGFIELFRRERVLSDYEKDDKLRARLNQIMRRVRLSPLPDAFAAILPAARRLVRQRRSSLLEGVVA
ncbi:MAG: hypothetical protein ABFC54_01890 [Thermoguttaceae bacterium]